MTVYSEREIYGFARAAGFDPHEAATWTAIAMAESGGRTTALNDRGEHSVGLWQINVAAGVRSNHWGNLNDPEVNARAAYEISHHGQDMSPWTTTHDSNKGTSMDYRHYLADVEQATGVHGDWAGVAGYGSGTRDPIYSATQLSPVPELVGAGAPVPSYDRIDAGASMTALDSDHDGLTDDFERRLGLNPHLADTDHDGLSDSFETLRSHTDPLVADSDHDGHSDAAEWAAGTPAVADHDHDGLADFTERNLGLDPHALDTDHDGLSDSMEISLGTDPTSADTDHDGIADGTEVQFHLNPLQADGGGLGGASAGGATGGMPAGPLGQPQPGLPSTPAAGQLSAASAVAMTTYPTATGTQSGGVGNGVGNGMGGGPGNGLGAIPGQGGPAGGADTGEHRALDTFLHSALAQAGDRYIFGAEVNLNDKNPTAFDCSELTQWAAHQAGVTIPDGAMYQYLQAKQQGHLIPVDQAAHTPGALLFYFSSEPTPSGGRPSAAHVAISLGNGKTIEARGTAYGVGKFSADDSRFNYAAVIPGISDQTPPPGWSLGDTAPGLDHAPSYDQIDHGASMTALDTDHDGLTDDFERRLGLNPHLADTDHDGLSDSFETLRSHTDPLVADSDHDGHSDAAEWAAGTPAVADHDHDGLADFAERNLGLNPHALDTDHDGLSDSMEISLGTDPTSADTDHDGIADGTEVQFHLDPLHADPTLGAGLEPGLEPGLDPALDPTLDPGADHGLDPGMDPGH